MVDDLKGSRSNGNFQGELLLKGYSGESYDSNLKVADDEHLDEVRLSVTWAGTEQTLKEFVFDSRIKSRGLLSRFCSPISMIVSLCGTSSLESLIPRLRMPGACSSNTSLHHIGKAAKLA